MPESTGSWEWNEVTIRTYISWIFQSSSKRATLSPSANIQLGDYGVIDEETTEFERRGNIFKDEEIIAIIPELATDDVWKPQASDGDKLVITYNMEVTDLGPNEDAKLRLGFTGSGDFLAMYRPRFLNIPQQTVDLTKLRKIQKLAGMRLVIGVVTCPAYALYHALVYYGTNSDDYTVKAILKDSNNDNSPVEQGWTLEMDEGWYKVGHNSEGAHEYTPLFSLRKITDGRDALEQTVPLIEPIRIRLPIPAPSAGDGNEIFKSGEIGVAPWLSKKSKRPEKWKNRPAAPSDLVGNGENYGESIPMVNTSAPEPPSTTAVNPSTRSTQASGAADQTRVYYSRRPENDANDCFSSCWCWCCWC